MTKTAVSDKLQVFLDNSSVLNPLHLVWARLWNREALMASVNDFHMKTDKGCASLPFLLGFSAAINIMERGRLLR